MFWEGIAAKAGTWRHAPAEQRRQRAIHTEQSHHATHNTPKTPAQVLRKSPAEIYRTHKRVSDLAAALNARTAKLLTTKWMPLPQEVTSRHKALQLTYNPSKPRINLLRRLLRRAGL